jgi:hypothetical protein
MAGRKWEYHFRNIVPLYHKREYLRGRLNAQSVWITLRPRRVANQQRQQGPGLRYVLPVPELGKWQRQQEPGLRYVLERHPSGKPKMGAQKEQTTRWTNLGVVKNRLWDMEGICRLPNIIGSETKIQVRYKWDTIQSSGRFRSQIKMSESYVWIDI